MKLKIDLLKRNKKSVINIVLGLILLAFAITLICFKEINHQTIDIYDWLFLAFFVIIGVNSIIVGLGFSFQKLCGKAFVWIDNDRISIKSEITDKEQIIFWKDIKSIEYKLNKYQIKMHDNTIITLDLWKLNYTLKNKIRKLIVNIAKDKNIQIDEGINGSCK